jgi:RHH-type rel operon transcriptional repressor/antitoxin RelB
MGRMAVKSLAVNVWQVSFIGGIIDFPKIANLNNALSRQLKDRLERLAESTKRSKSYLAAEAIAEYVDGNAWQVEEIRKAVQKADAGGPFVSEEDAARYLDALARGEDPKPPRTFRAR